ncbi:hypothetical protein [Streptomyces sp. NPDC048603]|uniref:hypothetical protein n=1 Tax=Streptomyces sp. NPDC048603 TaxID=3365577 RepID=UPI00372066E9
MAGVLGTLVAVITFLLGVWDDSDGKAGKGTPSSSGTASSAPVSPPPQSTTTPSGAATTPSDGASAPPASGAGGENSVLLPVNRYLDIRDGKAVVHGDSGSPLGIEFTASGDLQTNRSRLTVMDGAQEASVETCRTAGAYITTLNARDIRPGVSFCLLAWDGSHAWVTVREVRSATSTASASYLLGVTVRR